MKKISADDVKAMVEKEGLFLMEDIITVISNGVFSAPLQDCGCLQKPPYTTLYNKSIVEKHIATIKKYEVRK